MVIDEVPADSSALGISASSGVADVPSVDRGLASDAEQELELEAADC